MSRLRLYFTRDIKSSNCEFLREIAFYKGENDIKWIRNAVEGENKLIILSEISSHVLERWKLILDFFFKRKK